MSDESTETGKGPKGRKCPDPEENPCGYLLFHGWKPSETPPRRLTTRWIDPQAPAAGVKSVVKYQKPKPNGEMEDIKQTQITPAPWAERTEVAVRVQQEREDEDLHAYPSVSPPPEVSGPVHPHFDPRPKQVSIAAAR